MLFYVNQKYVMYKKLSQSEIQQTFPLLLRDVQINLEFYLFFSINNRKLIFIFDLSFISRSIK